VHPLRLVAHGPAPGPGADRAFSIVDIVMASAVVIRVQGLPEMVVGGASSRTAFHPVRSIGRG